MIVVTVELKSAISPTRDKVLGTLTIANDGTGTRTMGRYRAELRGVRGRLLGTTRVQDFPRTRLIVWDLVYRVLRATRAHLSRDPDDAPRPRRRVTNVGRFEAALEMIAGMTAGQAEGDARAVAAQAIGWTYDHARRTYARVENEDQDAPVEYERCICDSPGDNSACGIDHDQVQHEMEDTE